MANAFSKYDLLTVTPTVQASPDYAAGDVLFAPTEINNFFKDEKSAAQIVSICIIDKQVVGTQAFTLYFTYSSTALGTINATADVSIGTLEEIQATIPIVAGDWITANTDNANTCMLTDPATDGIGAIVKGSNWAGSSEKHSIHIVGIADATMNVASTSDLIIKIGVKYQ